MENELKITILTSPPKNLISGFEKILFKIKQIIKRNFWFLLPKDRRSIPFYSKYGGHHAVTRSIVEGMKKSGINFNYNPNREKIREIVFVPGGVEALKYAIKLKKNKHIKKLISGPNIVVSPGELLEIKDYKYIDLYLQPSAWVVDWWKDQDPDFPLPIEVWYAGVDIDFWKPSHFNKNKKNILIYKKNVPENIFLEIKVFFEKNNFIVETLEYGSYNKTEYLSALDRNSCIIHLTESESQGLSLAEAWSMDTPTFVWNPTVTKYKDTLIQNCSSAPYLSKETGKFFRNVDELTDIFSRWDPKDYSPRKWVILNMSDEICAKKLLSIINE